MLGFLLEQLPYPTTASRSSRTPTPTRLGLPRPVIHYDFDDYTRQGSRRARLAVQWFAQLGADDPTAYDGPSGRGRPPFTWRDRPYGTFGAGHLCGTHRMGARPGDSVVDPDQRSWDHRNLFLVGAGSMPDDRHLQPDADPRGARLPYGRGPGRGAPPLRLVSIAPRRSPLPNRRRYGSGPGQPIRVTPALLGDAVSEQATVRAMSHGELIALARLEGMELSPMRALRTWPDADRKPRMTITAEHKQTLIGEYATPVPETRARPRYRWQFSPTASSA